MIKTNNRIIQSRFVIAAVVGLSLIGLTMGYNKSRAALVTRTWDGGGLTNNWSDPNNWSGDTVPSSSDDVVFDSTSSKDAIFDTSASINRINVNTGYTGTISIADGMSLSTSGGDSSQSDGTINVGNGTLSFGSTFSFVLNGGTINAGNGTVSAFFFFTMNGGTFNGANSTFPSISLAGPVITVNGGTFIAPANMTVRSFDVQSSANYNHNNGSITSIGGNSTFISSSARTLNNLTLNHNDDGGISTNANTTVAGTLTLNDGLINSGTLRAHGPVSMSPNFGSVSQIGGGGNILIENGSGPRTIDFPAGVRLPNLRINDPNVSIVSSGSGTVITDDLWLESLISADFGENNLTVGVLGATDSSPFRMDSGTVTFTTGNFTKGTHGVFTINNGTFTMGTGTAVFSPAGGGGVQINGGTFNASTGTTTISLNTSGFLDQTGGTFNASGPLDINGNFSLSGGTFNASPTTTNFGFQFFHTGGIFNHNNGTAIFDSSHPAFSMNVTTNGGVETFNNMVFNPTTDNAQISFNNRTFRANGSLQILNGRMNAVTFEVAGDVTIGAGADGDNGRLTFIGSNAQTFTNNGGLNTTGPWTVNKSSGAVSAATDMLLTTNQTLNIDSGTLYLADGSDLTVGPMNVLASGLLINDSSTTITLGGNVSNIGNIFLLGGGAACPQSDSIIIRSSVNGTQRNWAGTGSFAIKDADVRDMSGVAPIITHSSTNSGNNGPNWTFDPACPPNVSISPQVLQIYRDQTQVFTTGGGFGNKTFSLEVNNSGATIDPTSGLYTPGNIINVTDTVRSTDVVGQFAEAQVTVIAGPPTKLAMFVQPPAAVTAGASIAPSIRVIVQDEFGNTVPNATNPVTISLVNNPGGSNLSGTLTRSAVNGIATFDDISLNRIGNGYEFQFNSTNLIGITSSTFNVNAGPPSQLIFGVEPIDTEALTVFAPPITVEVTDSLGNRVTNANNLITMSLGNNPAGGSLIGTTQRLAFAGVATFNNLQINNLGDGYTLSASAANLAGAASQSFNVISPFVVRNTNDAGPGSLRNAITKANQLAGQQTVTFAINGDSPHTIVLATGLPPITDPIVIDGTTQPGFSSSPIVEINGSFVPPQPTNYPQGLDIRSGNNTVKGLVINRFHNSAAIVIASTSSGGNTIQGNFIGTDITGNIDLGNASGIVVFSSNNLIGGTSPLDRNVVSGNTGGIYIGSGKLLNVVIGNFIGTNASGIAPIPNATGISVYGEQTTIGGIAPGEGNLIAFNTYNAVNLFSGDQNSVRGNSIHSNANLGIDLAAFGVSPNDPGDADRGANSKQNYPVIDFATGGVSTQIVGTLNSVPSSSFTLDFYANDTCDASGYGEGRVYLGSTNVSTNSHNLASFNVTLPAATTNGHFVTATATDADGNTSEFSQCRVTTPSVVIISGRVTDAGGSSLRAARLALTGPNGTRLVLTDLFGNYSVRNVGSAASYTLTASQANYDFAPLTRTYANINGDQTNQGFVGTKNRSTISGSANGLVNGVPYALSGVEILLSGAESRSTVTSGNYSFSNLPPGQYTVTPVKEGWTFDPPSIDVDLTLTDRVFTHFATTANPPEGRLFFSVIYPRVLNANGTAELTVNNRRIKPGFDASPDGRKIAYVGDKYHEPTGRDTLYIADSDGTGEIAVLNSGSTAARLERPRFSPDGSKVAYVFNSGASGALNSIRIRELAAGTTSVVTTGSVAQVGSPGWISPTRLVFSAFDGNDYEIYAVNTNGTNLVRLTDNSGPDQNPSVSYDGSRIAYNSFDLGNNTLSVMNSDGSNLQFLRTDGFQGGIGWSPDGTMLAIVRVFPNMNNSLVYSIINASNGTLIRDFVTSVAGNYPFFEWAPNVESVTPTGANVPVEAGGVDITFSGVTNAGGTTVTRIPPSSAGTAPNGFVLGGIAYEITTTAAYTAPVTVCFNVPSQFAPTQTAFNALSLMHNEGGVLVDRTTSRNFPTRTICGSVTTLSPFALAEQVDMALPSITGYIQDSNGVPMAGVSIELTGAENRFAETDVDGFFTFVNLIDGESYTVQPKQPGSLFTEYSQDFVAITGENSVVFTGTQANFQISGRVTNANGLPLAGRTVELEDLTFASTSTDANGDYVFNELPADGNYIVRALSLGAEAFNPQSHEVIQLTSRLAGLDFVQLAPTAANVSISGRATTANGNGISGVGLTLTALDGAQRTAITSSFGYYAFSDVEVGQTYVLEIAAKKYSFANPTRVLKVLDEITDLDFTEGMRPAPTGTIAGRVVDEGGRGVPHATVKLTMPTGEIRNAITGSFGYFSFEGLPTGDQYVFSIAAKGGTFVQPSMNLFLFDDIENIFFLGSETP